MNVDTRTTRTRIYFAAIFFFVTEIQNISGMERWKWAQGTSSKKNYATLYYSSFALPRLYLILFCHENHVLTFFIQQARWCVHAALAKNLIPELPHREKKNPG